MLAVRSHLRYHAFVTPFRVIVVVIFIWVLSAVIACSCLWDSNVLYAVLSASFISLLAGSVVVYVNIYSVVRRHWKQIHQQQNQQGNDTFRVSRFKKTALNTFFVCILLFVCYSPYVFVINMAFAGLNFSPSVYIPLTNRVRGPKREARGP